MKSLFPLLILGFLCLSAFSARWTPDKAKAWYQKYKWSAGFNYAPSYAVNEIQMWTSFNPDRIKQELQWANEIGFSVLRVFLHAGPYLQNPNDFLNKMSTFLNITSSLSHKVIFVLFDDCWKDKYQMGKQPDPTPGIHNSQWVQCPGNNDLDISKLQDYTKTVIRKFKDDERVVMWDLYNEVGNSGREEKSLNLTKSIFQWAQQINPSQPLTSGHWNGGASFQNINHLILSESDIITFHAYCDVSCTQSAIQKMKSLGRPVICTEYMARPLNSKFVTHLPVFKSHEVWAINWGFVFGRTQTYYPWWSKQGDPVPSAWFHDVVQADGTPFDKTETDFIRSITKQ